MSDLPQVECRVKNMYIKVRPITVKSSPIGRSLAVGLYGVVPPTSETKDPAALLYGGSRRAFVRLPDPDPNVLQEIRTSTRKWLKLNMKPIYSEPSVEQYLSEITVPLFKKEDIRKGYEFYQQNWKILDAMARWHYTSSVNDWVPNEYQWKRSECPFSKYELRLYKRFTEVGEFAKTEFYPSIKPTRGINASGGGVKSLVGPYFHSIEHQLFALPWFIKKITTTDRVDHVLKMHKPGYSTQSSDFSSFEGSFNRIVQECIEYELYDYMFPLSSRFKLWNRTLISPRFISNKNFNIVTDTCRMSGETNTSLGNGFTNLMLMLYALNKYGNKDINGVIEGDDGLFVFKGPGVPADFFLKAGFKVKLCKTSLNTASFCGMIFDLENKVIMADPYYALAASGFSFSAVGASRSTVVSLTCAKGLSMMFQYAGCPMLAAWGNRLYKTGLSMSGLSDKVMKDKLLKYYSTSQKVDQWERTKMLAAIEGREAMPIQPGTRLLFEQLYGITPDHQSALECEFGKTTGWYYNASLIEMYRSRRMVGLDGETSTYSGWCDNWFRLVSASETPVRCLRFEPNRSSIMPVDSTSLKTLYKVDVSHTTFDVPSVPSSGR